MFARKYIFETKRTKFIRLLLNVMVGVFSLFILTIFVGFYIPMVSTNESENADQSFYKKDPDLIAVYTGDSGRIEYAMTLAMKYKTSKVLISGVYSSTSIQTVLAQQGVSPDHEALDLNRIEIDHVAKNTIENVISTFHYLRNNPTYKKVLIISNDYHIMRIRLIVDEIKTQKDQFEFFYKGIPTDYWSVRNIKILYTEVLKYFKAWGFLLLWDKEAIGSSAVVDSI
ncbi:MAG: YdcF family protein [Bacteriovoracaceae bacterium]